MLSYEAWRNNDYQEVARLNDYFLASRETIELRSEAEQMGWSLLQVAQALEWGGIPSLNQLRIIKPVSLLTAHSYASFHLNIQAQNGLAAYSFSWIENQVSAKSDLELIDNFSPMMSILSSRHESLYSRLFRS